MTKEQIEKLKKGDRLTVTFKVYSNKYGYVDATFEDSAVYEYPDWYGTLGHGILNHATLQTPLTPGDTVLVVPDPITNSVWVRKGGEVPKAGTVAQVKSPTSGEDGTVLLETRRGVNLYQWRVSAHCLELIKTSVTEESEQ